jgi:GINS complex subunit 2
LIPSLAAGLNGIADRLEKLQALLKDEKENGEGFEPLPRRFLETSKILLDV